MFVVLVLVYILRFLVRFLFSLFFFPSLARPFDLLRLFFFILAPRFAVCKMPPLPLPLPFDIVYIV
jgi:hypothetical protein